MIFGILSFLFLTFFSIVLLVLAFHFRKKGAGLSDLQSKATQTTQGTVVEYVASPRYQLLYLPLYSYWVDGKEYFQKLEYKHIIFVETQGKHDVEVKGDPLAQSITVYNYSLSKTFPLGSQLPVYYQDGQPQNSYVARAVNFNNKYKHFSILFTILSLADFLLAIFFLLLFTLILN